jgi:hypothetical protein
MRMLLLPMLAATLLWGAALLAHRAEAAAPAPASVRAMAGNSGAVTPAACPLRRVGHRTVHKH